MVKKIAEKVVLMEGEVKNGMLTLVIPLGKGYLSSTGKSTIIFTSSGFTSIGGYRVNVNVLK